MLEVVKNAENDIFSLVSSNLMSIFIPNVDHQKKNIEQVPGGARIPAPFLNV